MVWCLTWLPCYNSSTRCFFGAFQFALSRVSLQAKLCICRWDICWCHLLSTHLLFVGIRKFVDLMTCHGFFDLIVQSSGWLELLSLPAWESLVQEAVLLLACLVISTHVLFVDTCVCCLTICHGYFEESLAGGSSSPSRASHHERGFVSVSVISSHSLFVSVSGVCCDCCGLCDVSKRGWLNLLSVLSSVPLRWRKICVKRDGELLQESSTGCYLTLTSVYSDWLLLSTMAQKYWVRKLTMFLSHSRQEVAFVQQMSSTGCCLTLTSLLHMFRLAAIAEELLVQGPSSVHCGSEILGPQAHNVSEWQ